MDLTKNLPMSEVESNESEGGETTPLIPSGGFLPRTLLHWAGAFSGGVLLGITFLFPAFSDLVWVALVPLFLLIRERDARGNFLMGWLVGFPWFFISCHWLRHVTVAGWVCLALFEATWLGLWMMAAGRFHTRWRLAVLPMLWVAMEMVRSKGPLGFSWNLLGHAADPLLFLVQGWGVYGLSFAIVGANAAVAWLILMSLKQLPCVYAPDGAGFFLLVPVLWLGVGWWEVRPVPIALGEVEVAMVQGSFPQSLKWTVPPAQAVSRYVGLTDEVLKDYRPDLIVWPEAAIPTILSEEPPLLEFLRDQTTRWRTPLLFGVLDQDRRKEGASHLFNSVVLLDPVADRGKEAIEEPRQVSQFLRGTEDEPSRSLFLPSVHAGFPSGPVRVYDKARLLPFGEYVPFAPLIPFVQKFVEDRGGGAFSAGKPGRVLETRFGEIGPLVCFESTYSSLARQAVLNGAQLLINVTNDAWFLKTAATHQHALQCRFRAVETGRAVVRAANTGTTAVYMPDGSIRSELPEWTQTAGVAKVPLYSHLTFSARVGDCFAWLCLICFAFSLWNAAGPLEEETT
jgi:apolipoprotein N-acyltransferase